MCNFASVSGISGIDSVVLVTANVLQAFHFMASLATNAYML